MIGDTFRTVQWYLATAGFLAFFVFVLTASKKFKINAQYSTWISLFVLVFGVILMNSTMNQKMKTASQADRSSRPQKLLISQADASSIIVTWYTDKEDLQFIEYTSGDKWQYAYPEFSKATNNHSVKIINLETGIKYTFQIRSSSSLYKIYENKPLEFLLR